MKNKSKIRLSRLHWYCRSRLGFSSKKNQSIYQIACEALALDGKPKPSKASDKDWVEANAAYLNYFVVPSRKEQNKVKLDSEYRDAVENYFELIPNIGR